LSRNSKKIVNISKVLRKNTTDTERYLWRYIRNRQIEGLKFRRQQPIGQYVVDFVNFEKKIVIELDGGHHTAEIIKDKQRDNWLKVEGFRVLRFWDNDVFKNTQGVLEVIRNMILSGPSPRLSHKGRGDERS